MSAGRRVQKLSVMATEKRCCISSQIWRENNQFEGAGCFVQVSQCAPDSTSPRFDWVALQGLLVIPDVYMQVLKIC